MTRRIRDRERVKREVEASKRALERARPWTERPRGALPPPVAARKLSPPGGDAAGDPLSPTHRLR